MDAASGFDAMYRATNCSAVYAEAVRASSSDLPGWLVPYSFVGSELLERIATELNVGTGQIVLDIGCGAGGPGVWLAERTGAEVVGVDFSSSAIAAATRLADQRGLSSRARFVVADATATTIPDASVDAVMSVDAMMFVDAGTAAREVARVLRPGGVLAMTSPESLVGPFFPTIVSDYRPFFEGAGFKTIRHEELAGYADRQVSFYKAIVERSDRLLAEMGESAEQLLDEARSGIAPRAIRVRHLFYVAERR